MDISWIIYLLTFGLQVQCAALAPRALTADQLLSQFQEIAQLASNIKGIANSLTPSGLTSQLTVINQGVITLTTTITIYAQTNNGAGTVSFSQTEKATVTAAYNTATQTCQQACSAIGAKHDIIILNPIFASAKTTFISFETGFAAYEKSLEKSVPDLKSTFQQGFSAVTTAILQLAAIFGF